MLHLFQAWRLGGASDYNVALLRIHRLMGNSLFAAHAVMLSHAMTIIRPLHLYTIYWL